MNFFIKYNSWSQQNYENKIKERHEIKPLVLLFHLEFRTKLLSAKPQFLNSNGLNIEKSRETYFDANNFEDLLKNVFKTYFELIDEKNLINNVLFYVLFEKVEKRTKNWIKTVPIVFFFKLKMKIQIST